MAVVDLELGDVVAAPVDGQVRAGGGGGRQGRGAAGGPAEQGPGVAERVMVGVGGAAAVECECVADPGGPVGAGVGDRAGVVGADGDGVGGAVQGSVVDDELGDIGAGPVQGESWV